MDKAQNDKFTPSKNWDYRLPYRELLHLRDIHETLDEELVGTIKKSDLPVALRAAGMMIDDENMKDILYEYGLEEEERVTMDTYFIIVAKYKRDQTFLHGKLLDGTVLELPRLGPVKISEIFDHSGNPFDPPSMLFVCAVVRQTHTQYQDLEESMEYNMPWEFARLSFKVKEYLQERVNVPMSDDDINLAALFPLMSTPWEEKAKKTLRGAFLGIYTDVNPSSNLKRLYEYDSSGNKVKNPAYVKPDEDDPEYEEKKNKEYITKRIQQFIVPDDILRKKLCNPHVGQPLSDVEYEEFLALLPHDDEIFVREHQDAPSNSKDMEGVLDTVTQICRNFAFGEDGNPDGDDSDDGEDEGGNEGGLLGHFGNEVGREGLNFLRGTKQGLADVEHEMGRDLQEAGKTAMKGFVGAGNALQAGLNSAGLQVNIDALGILNEKKRQEASDMGSEDSEFVDSHNSKDSESLSVLEADEFSSTGEISTNDESLTSVYDFGDEAEETYLGQLSSVSKAKKESMIDNVSRAMQRGEHPERFAVLSDKYAFHDHQSEAT